MSKAIAIITGATGGIGREFVKLMLGEQVDEIWAIARNPQKLSALKNEYGERIIPISKDLTNFEELRKLGYQLDEEKPDVAYLINNAGIAKLGTYQAFSPEEVDAAIRINCGAMAILCTLCLPHMKQGARILNISSASSFQPLPYLNLYSATKAFERYYSRALQVELRGTGITATAVCPSWVDTELLMKEINGKKVRFDGMVTAERMAKTALRDAKKGRAMSVCSGYVKWLHVLSKVSASSVLMDIWMRKIKKYT